MCKKKMISNTDAHVALEHSYKCDFDKSVKQKMNRRRLKCCCVIFSKDRPLQLHATLESFKTNVTGVMPQDVFIILKASDTVFEKHYRKVKFEFNEYIFIRETNFKQDLLSIVANPYYSHVLFSVDDNIFALPVAVSDVMKATYENRTAIGFSLRLGTNISFCHPLNRNQTVPTYREINSEAITWNWKDGESDFGYPLELSSSVYRTSLMKNLCQKLEYHNPNTLEDQLNRYKNNLYTNVPWLISFKTSRCFCIPMNLTQHEYTNRHSKDTKYSITSLLEIYKRGQKMNVVELYGQIHNSPHVEIKYSFVPRKK